jgi:hypothetical protein
LAAKKELKEIVKEAEKQGWRVKRTKKGHLMFLAPDGINLSSVGQDSARKVIRRP